MIRIGITAEAFKAIKATLPLGSVGFDHERTTNGGLVWLDARTMNNLEALACTRRLTPQASPSAPRRARKYCARPSSADLWDASVIFSPVQNPRRV